MFEELAPAQKLRLCVTFMVAVLAHTTIQCLRALTGTDNANTKEKTNIPPPITSLKPPK